MEAGDSVQGEFKAGLGQKRTNLTKQKTNNQASKQTNKPKLDSLLPDPLSNLTLSYLGHFRLYFGSLSKDNFRGSRDAPVVYRACYTLAEDWNSVPSVQLEWFIAVCNFSSREFDTLFLPQRALELTCTYLPLTYIYT